MKGSDFVETNVGGLHSRLYVWKISSFNSDPEHMEQYLERVYGDFCLSYFPTKSEQSFGLVL